MIIILEGPDGAGKSTLASKLSQDTRFPIVSNKQKDGGYGYYRELIETDNIILDRAWYSEMVYGPIKRVVSRISKDQMLGLEHRLSTTYGGLIIHCTAPTVVLWDRCITRGEDYITDYGMLDNLRTSFVNIFAGQHYIPVVKYEYKNMS